MSPAAATALVVLATWDGWRWSVLRIASAPEEGAALALTVVFLAVTGRLRRRALPEGAIGRFPFWLLAGILAAYAITFCSAPPIVRAAIALSASLFCLYVALFRERPPVAFWGLVALALPVLPSLQVTFGYPMRIVSAALTVGLLEGQGLAVARQGTFLRWRGETIQFDAPCSGINMLWAQLLLTLMGCILLRLGAVRTLAAVSLAFAFAIAANVLRASSLFYVETGLITGTPHWWHEGIGLAAFSMSAAASLWVLTRLQDREAIR
jgi:exosortase/archaeosortase family protein